MTKPESGDDLEKALKNLRKSRQECASIIRDTQGALEDQQADHVIILKNGSKVLTSYPTTKKPAKPARRPKGTKKAKPSTSIQKPKSAKRQPKPPKPHHKDNIVLVDNKVIAVDDIDHSDNSDFRSATKLKDQMTLKELKFLEIYLTGDYNIERAAIAAGYEGYSQRHLYRIGQKIVEKYETQADDHRKIFRAMGAGEVAVVEGLLKLARKAKSEMVRLNAWSMIAKCIGLTKEQIEGVGGITIIFEAADQPAVLPEAPPALPVGEPRPAAGLPAPIKPLQITR